jgi:methylated-DNA-[protein]-cysteine S-methyltransferase
MNIWMQTIPSSPIGILTIAVSQNGLVRIMLAPISEMIDEIGDQHISIQQPAPAILNSAVQQLKAYLEGKQKIFDLPIEWDLIRPFDQIILRACQQIPYGKVVSYGELGAMAGKPNSARAVGGVMARNPIPLVIPCHRVVNASGGLHGYSARGGLNTKAWLLQMEGHTIVNQKLG